MTKPEITLPIPQSVLAICTAYESGFGDGINGLIKRCPYSESSDAAHAWRYGVVEGNKKRAAEPAPNPCTHDHGKFVHTQAGTVYVCEACGHSHIGTP